MEDLGIFLEKMDSLSPEEMFSQYLDKNWNLYQTGTPEEQLEGGIKYFHAAELMQRKGEWGKMYRETAENSFEWLQKSCGTALLYLAKCHLNAMGTEQDTGKSKEYLEIVTEIGSVKDRAEAYYQLGINWKLFYGLADGEYYGLENLKKAARLGHEKAQEKHDEILNDEN